VRAGKRLQGLATALTAAMLLAVPPLAHADPQFRINGMLVGTARQNVTAFGTVTMDNKLYGEWKCKVLAGLTVGNETEKGVAAVERWEPFDCSTKECNAPTVTTEHSVEWEPTEKVEKIPHESSPIRGPQSVPWPAELISSAGHTAMNVRKMRIVWLCPEEAFELPFTGNLEPRIVNGTKNGLNPSHIVFEGKGGNTSFLTSPFIEGGAETENSEFVVSGELAILGTGEELITAE
jgi:hypothetical protein